MDDVDTITLGEMRLLLRKHAPEAVLRLVELMRESKSDATCLKAAELILVKAYASDKGEASAKAKMMEDMPRAKRIEVLREALAKEELADARSRGMIS